MNRKLHHTILAFSTVGVTLCLGLMAARPLLPGDMQASSAESRAMPHAEEASTGAEADAPLGPQRSGRSRNHVIAVPYFSFARGAGRGSRS